MINLIALAFAAFGLYSLFAVFTSQHYVAIIGVVLTLAAAIGLWLRKNWSQYLVYVLSVGGVTEWLWLVWRSFQNNQWPSGGILSSVIALIPGICLLFFFIGSSAMVFRYFRRIS